MAAKKAADKQRSKLIASLQKELIRTDAWLRLSRRNRWSRGVTAKIRRIELRYHVYPPLEGESRQEYVARLQEEAAKRCITTDDLLMPYIGVDVTYWELPGTSIVYVDECMIARLNDEGILKKLSLDTATPDELQQAIEGLQQLRSTK